MQLSERAERTFALETNGASGAIAGPAIRCFASLKESHPKLNLPVVDGLVRQGETCNIVSGPKVGKSWLAYDLALSITAGKPWLERFPCTPGRVLLIDNELHEPTLAHRIPMVAKARGVESAMDHLDVLPLRGRDMSIRDLGTIISGIGEGEYRAIIADAWYRFIPAGVNENSNADIMALYNLLDRYAASTDAAWFLVHHTSKGGQADKSVTDTGAGAGSQSRAADAHVVLRPHEDDGCVVMEAAVRSFPRVAPLGLRWDFPVWHPVEVDTKALKGRKTRGEERQDERTTDGLEAVRQALAENGPMTPRQVRGITGFGNTRTDRLLDILTSNGEASFKEIKVRGNPAREYTLHVA